MLKKILLLLVFGSPCWAQTTGSVNGIPGQSFASMAMTQTAGAGGVSVNTFVAPDASAPSRFVTAASGSCGAGVALGTTAAGGTFALSDLLGTVQVKTDSGGAIAGHLLVGSTAVAGLAMDSGQTSSLNISAGTPLCGLALNTVSGSGLVTMNARTRGGYGQRIDLVNGASVPAAGGITTTNAAGQLVNLKQIAGLWSFGDSILYGGGTAIPASQSGFAILAGWTPGAPAYANAISGRTAPSVSADVIANYNPDPVLPSAVIMDSGANDGNLDACGGGAGTNCVKNYHSALLAAVANAVIPYQYRMRASKCTLTGGTWPQYTNFTPYVSDLLSPGYNLYASSVGAKLTCTLTTPVATTYVGVSYPVINGATGTFTMTLDGNALTDYCSGTSTFSTGPCGGQALATPVNSGTIFRQEFAAASASTTHTLVITAVSSGVPIASFDAVPPTAPTNENVLFFLNTISIWPNSSVYNAEASSLLAAEKSEGLLVNYVDVTSSSSPGPGVNSTTDIATVATAQCPATVAAQHPNRCGYLNQAKTIFNAEVAAGFQFSNYFSGFSVTPGTLTNKSYVTNVNTVTSSATPVLNSSYGMQYVLLSANATPSISGMAAGQVYTLEVCQPASGGPYTWTAPAVMHGAVASATVAGMANGTCAVQTFRSFNGTTLQATGAAVTGIAP